MTEVPAEGPKFGLKEVDSQLVMWYAVAHRDKTMHPPTGHKIHKLERFYSAFVENWNRANYVVNVPGVGALNVMGKLYATWDITPWFQRVAHAKKREQTMQRVHRCQSCLKKGEAFCDVRVPQGPAWDAVSAMWNRCVPDESSIRDVCQGSRSMDRSGVYIHKVTGVWHTLHDGGATGCSAIGFLPHDEHTPVPHVLRRFIRRQGSEQQTYDAEHVE